MHRLGGPRRRRRGDRPRPRLPVGARAAAVAAGRQLHGHARRPGGLRRACCRTGCASAPATWRPTTPRRSSRTRCGCSTRSAPRPARCSPTRRGWSTTSTPRRWPTASGCRPGCELLGIAVRGRRDARPGPRLLHAHALRVPELGARATRSPRSSAAAATTASSSSSAVRPRPGIGFGCGIERVLLTCDAEGVFAGARVAGRLLRRRHHRRRGRHRARASVLRDAGVATDRAFDGRSMKSQMKAAGKSRRPGRASSSARTRRRPARSTIRDLDGGRADDRRPRDASSTTSGRCWTRDRADAHAHVRRAARRARGPVGRAVRLGRPPARARRAPRVHRPARPHRRRAVRGRRRPRPAQRVRRPHHRHRPRPARGHRQRRAGHRRGRGGRLRRRGALGRRCRRRSRSTSGPTTSTR